MFDIDWTMCSEYANHSRLNSQHNWGDLYVHLMGTIIFTLIMNMIFIFAPKPMRQMATGFGFANYLALIACFIYYEKWVQRQK